MQSASIKKGGYDMETRFTFGSVLKIIFKYIQARPSVLAEQYVYRDRTLIYKWLRDTVFPPKMLFPDILRFVMERSSEPVRGLIRMEMDRYISETDLEARFKKTLDEKSDFEEYLNSVFCLLSAVKIEKVPKYTEITEPSETPNQPILPPADEKPAPSFQPPIAAPAERTIHIRLTSAAMITIGFALLAAISGEILWGIIAYALQWSYAPGELYHAASGLPAFLWGFFHVVPVAVFGMLSIRKAAPLMRALSGFKKLEYIGCYALAGGIGGVLLAGSGLSGMAQSLTSVPTLQGAILVFIRALVLSFFPLLILLALLKFPKTTPFGFLFLEFCPALLCLLAALPTLLSCPLSTGQVSLGGFFAGFVLKVLMFVSIRTVLKVYPGTIKLAFSEMPQA